MNREEMNESERRADKGVDINCRDREGYMAFHFAVLHNQIDTVRLFLDKGVDIDCKDDEGETALHIAAYFNECDMVNLLLDRGADASVKNNRGDDALALACERHSAETMNILLQRVFKDVNRHIECYQRLGTRLIFDYLPKITEGLIAWRQAITLSVENNIRITAAKLTTPIGTAVEATSFSELDDLSQDLHALDMQCIVLTYKFFGPNHANFFTSIRRKAKQYYKIKSYDQWLQLITYCLLIIRKSTLDIHGKILELKLLKDECLCYALDFASNDVKTSLSFCLVYEFMEAVSEAALKCTEQEEKKQFLHLIVLAIIQLFSVKCENHQKLEFQKLIRSPIAKARKYRSGGTLLMTAVNLLHKWRIDISLVLHVAEMLLDCGEDINQPDGNGNNVVHHLFKRRVKYDLPFLNIRDDDDANYVTQIAAKFVEYGAHLDAQNRDGMRTVDCLRKLGIRITPPIISLMCIAARGIRKHNISVKGMLPNFLLDFVETH